MPSIGPKTIAYFSVWKTALAASVIFVLQAAGVWVIIKYFLREDAHGTHLWWLASASFGMICFAPVTFRIIQILSQILYDDRKALWAQDGNLICTNRGAFHIGLLEISDVESAANSATGAKQVILKLRDGRSMPIATGLMQPSNDEIVESLRELITKFCPS